MVDWKVYKGVEFDFSREKLTDNWYKIHAGNCEPIPENEAVLEIWRNYHQGDFFDAYELGVALGGEAMVPAAHAITTYAQFIEPSNDKRLNLFLRAIDIAILATEQCPNSANAFNILAVAYGRYSQFNNVVDSLKQGIAPKIKDAIVRCLELTPNNSDAMLTFAGWHSEIAVKMGSTLAGLTYGAKKNLAEKYYDQAIAITPNSPIVYAEKARGLLLMYGKSKKNEATKLLVQACKSEPVDTMQWLNIENTKAYMKKYLSSRLKGSGLFGTNKFLSHKR